MNAEEFRKSLEQSSDKLSLFASVESLDQDGLSTKEFLDFVVEFLSDTEKLRLLDYPNIKQIGGFLKGRIIRNISDENILSQVINNDNIMSDLKSFQIVDIIKKMSDGSKQQILHNQEFIERYQIDEYGLLDFFSTLTDETKVKELMDSDFIINKLHLGNSKIVGLINGLNSEDLKEKVMERYQLEAYQRVDILNKFSSSHKLEALLKQKDFSKSSTIDVLQTLDIKTLANFLAQHNEFCSQQNIRPYEIIRKLDPQLQIDFIKDFDNVNLSFSEKKEILVTLSAEAKQNIDESMLKEEYRSALSIQTEGYDQRVVLDLERNLNDYQGLDNLIRVNPQDFTQEQRAKFIKVCDICPNIQVISQVTSALAQTSTGSEYKDAEEWINSIIDNLNPENSKAQNLAIIDNAIGKKISYSPDFGTEAYGQDDSRALWKIISSGYGVCNGISAVEKYILNRVGIESELIGSDTHSFLKIKDIELPLANGETVKGNTILDPTWNLTSHRFGGRPSNFCISYEQARKNDIDDEGKDYECHKNDEQLQDATLNLDEESLRGLFTSVGLADREGNFPIKSLIEKSEEIDKLYANQPEQNINQQFLLLSQTCPEFAKCQNSSMRILKDILLDNENLEFNKCVVDRVYAKGDEDKKAVLYVYINSNEMGERFFFASKDEGQLIGVSKGEFINQFECYEEDLENMNGIKPWETKEQIKEENDLSISSGKVVAEEGREI